MTDSQLGPRTIYYVDDDGVHHPMILRIEFSPIESFDLGNAIAQQTVGSIYFEGNWKIRPIKVYGEDRLQVVYRLMCLADATIQRITRECGLVFFKIVQGDIKEPLDVFS